MGFEFSRQLSGSYSPPKSNSEVLSNWLARQTVNLVSAEHVGSNPTTSTYTIRKDKPIGGGHGFENRSELTTRVGSIPTSSALVGRNTVVTVSYYSFSVNKTLER